MRLLSEHVQARTMYNPKIMLNLHHRIKHKDVAFSFANWKHQSPIELATTSLGAIYVGW